MRRVMFVAYDFPPCSNIGGSLRSEKFVKYLPNFGWQATVLCLAQDTVAEPETYPDVIRIASMTPYERPYQVTPYGWLPPLWKTARKILKEDRHDLLYVTCPPFFHSLVIQWLKNEFKLPVVVDFRDAWSLDPYMEGSRLKQFLYRRIFPMAEQYILQHCDCFIANTPSAKRAYLDKYRHLDGRIVLIPNGFDESDFAAVTPIEASPEMTFLYCGRFGICARDPFLLLQTFKKAVEEMPEIRLKIIGSHSPGLAALVGTFEIKPNVQLQEQISHHEAIQAMLSSDVLVLYNETQKQTKLSMVAGKTYEYLRSGKPVLAIGPPGDNLNIISQYAGRHEVVDRHDGTAVLGAIRRLYSDWQAGRFKTYTEPRSDFTTRFNRQVLTADLVTCFNRVLERG